MLAEAIDFTGFLAACHVLLIAHLIVSLRLFLTQSAFPVAPPAHLAPSSGHLSNAQPARAFVQGDVGVAHEDRIRGLAPNRREFIEIHTP